MKRINNILIGTMLLATIGILANCEVNPEPEMLADYDFMISKVVEEFDSANGVWVETEVVDNITQANVGDKIRFTLLSDPSAVDFLSIWPGDSTRNWNDKNYYSVNDDLELVPEIGRGYGSFVNTQDYTYRYPSEGNSSDGTFTVVLVATNMAETIKRATLEKKITILPEPEDGE